MAPHCASIELHLLWGEAPAKTDGLTARKSSNFTWPQVLYEQMLISLFEGQRLDALYQVFAECATNAAVVKLHHLVLAMERRCFGQVL